MKLTNFTILAHRIEPDSLELNEYVLDLFKEKFSDNVVSSNTLKFPGEYNITVKIKTETKEIRKFSYQVEEDLQNSGINAIVILETA